MPGIDLSAINGLFTVQGNVKTIEALPPIETTIMDRYFKGRPINPSALLSVSEIQSIIGTVPVIQRGGQSISIGGPKASAQWIEPHELRPSIPQSGADLNNLKLMLGNKASLPAWRSRMIDRLRKTCRLSTEAMAAMMLTGVVNWPMATDSGTPEEYVIEYGQTNTVTVEAGNKWNKDGVALSSVEKTLSEMATKNSRAGFGGKVEYEAGEDAWNALYDLVVGVETTAKMRIEIDGDDIKLNGRTVHKMAEEYPHPITGAWTPKVPKNKIVGISTGTEGQIFYSALDDLDANLQPLPFFAKPVKNTEGNGFSVIGTSKPTPARPVKSICWATVIA